MYKYSKGNYVYSGGQGYGSPIREHKSLSAEECAKWERMEKKIKSQNKK